jgi:hypothetical protein
MTRPAVAVSLALVLFAPACRTGVPVIDTGSKPPTQEGTIAGHVTTEADAPVTSRVVRAIPIDGGQPYETSTNAAGTYTLKVRPGRYRLEVEVRQGERLVKQPDQTEVNPSDLDPDRDFVLAPAP